MEYYIQQWNNNGVNFRIDDSFGEVNIIAVIQAVKETGLSAAFIIKTGGSIVARPVASDDIVYFGCTDHKFYAVNFEDGREIWRLETGGVIVSPAHLYNGILYFGSYDRNLYAVKKNGNLLWKFPATDAIVSEPKVLDNGKLVVFGSKDTNLYAVTADKGELKWKFAAGGYIDDSITVHEDIVYFGSWDYRLHAVDKNGNKLWDFKTNGMIGSQPIVHNETLYFTSGDHNLYALSLDGKEKWRFKAAGPLRTVAAKDDLVLCISRDNHVYALTEDGNLRWKFKTGEMLAKSLAIEDGMVLVGGCDNNFYCLDLDGHVLWKFSVKSIIVPPAITYKDSIFFGCEDCHLYKLDLDGNLIWKFQTSLSYPATYDVESLRREKSVEVVWKPIASPGEDLTAKEEESNIADYGEFSGAYIDTSKSDYMSSSVKGYIKKKG
jgi:outer membrane protein assembly factor BamB